MATKRTKVKRLPKRGHYDRPTIDAILDEAILCHIGFEVDGYRGEKVAHGVPESWCFKLPSRKARYDPRANAAGCYDAALAAIRAKRP